MISPISKLQKYNSSIDTFVLSATTIISCFWQGTSSAVATICVYLSPSYSMTVWPSPRKYLAKNLISWCLLLELLKNSWREWRTFILYYIVWFTSCCMLHACSWSLVVFDLYLSSTMWHISYFKDTYLRSSFITP